MTELEMVLGYREAIDPRAALHVDDVPMAELAADVFTMPCWRPEFCAAIIRAAEAVGAFEPQPDDPVPGHEVSLAVISPKLFAAVEADFGERVWPQLRKNWPIVDYYGLRDAFVIRYALGEQESLRLHHDVAQISGSIKLNDGYTGGVLEFPRQGVDNAAVPVGELLVWPSLVTHPHRTGQLEQGVKYALTVWFELPQV